MDDIQLQDLLNNETLLLSNHKYVKDLSIRYRSETNRVICTSCSSDIQEMLYYFKSKYTTIMATKSNYLLNGVNPYYKVERGSSASICNASMTDEKAIDFLRKGDFESRLKLFKITPENVREVVLGDTGHQDLVDTILEGAKTTEDTTEDTTVEVTTEDTTVEETTDCCDDTTEPCEDCQKEKTEELLKLKLQELKTAYPDFKYKVGMTKKEFVELIIKG